MIYVSPSCKSITGYEPMCFIQDPQLFSSILHPDDREFVKKQIENCNKDNTSPLEFRIFHKNGDIHWISHICRPIYDRKGRFAGRRGSNRDITSRKIAQIALFENEKRFHSALHLSHDGIILIDRNGKVIYWNKASYDIFGFKEEQMNGQSISNVIPELGNALQKDVLRKKDMNKDVMEFTGKGRLRPDIPLEISISRDESAETYYCIIVRDITKRKESEKELQNKAEKLRLSNELKDVFTDILRHDLLNPAGIVKGFAEVMLMQELDPDRREKLEIIIRNNNKIIKLIEDASKLSKLEASKPIRLDEMDLGMIVGLAAGNIQYLFEEKGMQLKVNTKGNYPCLANPILDEVFINLLSNAQKYSPEKTTVSMDILDCSKHWKVLVTDTGEGICDADKELVFERFKRVTKGPVKGTGLGLAIVKRIIEMHGGNAGVEDNPEGQGCTFWVTVKKAPDSN